MGLWWVFRIFVLLLLLNVWLMFPFTVCPDLGRYSLTRSTVNPEKVANKVWFIASIHVEIGGLKHALWGKVARFCFDDISYTEFSENCSRIGDGFIYFSVSYFSFIFNINIFVKGSIPSFVIIFFVFLSIVLAYFPSKTQTSVVTE